MLLHQKTLHIILNCCPPPDLNTDYPLSVSRPNGVSVIEFETVVLPGQREYISFSFTPEITPNPSGDYPYGVREADLTISIDSIDVNSGATQRVSEFDFRGGNYFNRENLISKFRVNVDEQKKHFKYRIVLHRWFKFYRSSANDAPNIGNGRWIYENERERSATFFCYDAGIDSYLGEATIKINASREVSIAPLYDTLSLPFAKRIEESIANGNRKISSNITLQSNGLLTGHTWMRNKLSDWDREIKLSVLDIWGDSILTNDGLDEFRKSWRIGYFQDRNIDWSLQYSDVSRAGAVIFDFT